MRFFIIALVTVLYAIAVTSTPLDKSVAVANTYDQSKVFVHPDWKRTEKRVLLNTITCMYQIILALCGY